MGIKFTYNNLDWLIPWYVDDYVVLNKEQNTLFEQEFESLWEWHRNEELPKYVEMLTLLQKDLSEGNMDMQKLVDYQDKARELYEVVAIKAVTRGINLISSLDEEQMEDIRDFIAEETAEFEEYLLESPREDRLKKRIRSSEKNFRKWLGPLTKKQKLIIEQWGQSVETTLEYRFEYFKKTRSAFLTAMQNRQDKELLESQLLYLITDRDEFHSKEYLEVRDRNRERVKALLLQLEESLTTKQRERLLRRIDNYKSSFAELVAETNET
jgi:hypothetical protein